MEWERGEGRKRERREREREEQMEGRERKGALTLKEKKISTAISTVASQDMDYYFHWAQACYLLALRLKDPASKILYSSKAEV